MKKIEFYKGKSDCKVIVFVVWSLRQSPGGFSGAKRSKIFWLLNVFKAIKRLTMILTKTIFMAEEAITVHNQPVSPG